MEYDKDLKIIESEKDYGPTTIWKGQAVCTREQAANFYGVSKDNITDNFNNNKGRYIEFKHYFKLLGEDLRLFKSQPENFRLAHEFSSSLTLFTERGMFQAAKSCSSDKAWEVYEDLVEVYFKVKELTPEEVLEKGAAAMLAQAKGIRERKVIQSQLNAANVENTRLIDTNTGLTGTVHSLQGEVIEANTIIIEANNTIEGIKNELKGVRHFQQVRNMCKASKEECDRRGAFTPKVIGKGLRKGKNVAPKTVNIFLIDEGYQVRSDIKWRKEIEGEDYFCKQTYELTPKGIAAGGCYKTDTFNESITISIRWAKNMSTELALAYFNKVEVGASTKK